MSGKIIDYTVKIFFHVIEKFVYSYQRQRNHYISESYKARAKSCGKGVIMNGHCEITGIENLELCENTHIGEGAYIRAEGGLHIGAHTHIARRVTIYTYNHDYKGKRIPYDENFIFKPVFIGQCVWIGINVNILPGAIIGEGSIIGAGCTIKGEVPPFSIVLRDDSGQIVTTRDALHYKNLEEEQSFGGKNGHPYP
jgi:acetyltransferase-like isoleucine patch superfamily enzyme